MKNKKIRLLYVIAIITFVMSAAGCVRWKANDPKSLMQNAQDAEESSIKENKVNDAEDSGRDSKANITTDANGNVVYEYEENEDVNYNSTEPVKDGTEQDDFLVKPDVEILYEFRNEGLLAEHFEKHGQEFPYDTKEDYLLGANIMLQNPDKLHKKEKEDNDDVYYLEATNEFIIVSTDGYIRTYFKPSKGKKYYDNQ